MDINQLLQLAIVHHASDLHLKAGNHPMLRIYGGLHPLTQFKPLMPEDTRRLADAVTNDYQKQLLTEQMDIDIAYSVEGFGRFRGSIYHQRSSLAVVMRIIPLKIHSIQDLNLPRIIEKISMEQRGLVLVTGTTGSGKSTTLAAIIDHINSNRPVNIITIEDPIEFLHRDKMCMISQREVGTDVQSFNRGLRACLREDPDVILVGEMRDIDTIETALLAAETGHLVLSTLHTLDAPESVNRIVSVFPPHHQRQIRLQLASILKAIISMRLIPKQDGSGRVPAVEVMINTQYIAECINNKDKTFQIIDAIKAGVSEYGMQTFDQSIYHLFKKEFISYEQGIQHCTNPNHFKLRVMGVETSMDMGRDDLERSLDESDQTGSKDEADSS